MLRVHKGKTERCAVTEEDFKAVAEALRKQVLDYVMEDNHILLKTAFTRWSKEEVGLIACKTEETKTWYKAAVDKIDLGGVIYRAWDGPDEDDLKPARINVTDLGLEAGQILKLIIGLNPEIKGKITLLRSDVYTSRNNRQDIILLGIDDIAAASLWTKSEPWIVELGTDQRMVQYSGKKDLEARLREQGQTDLAEQLRRTTLHPSDDVEEELADFSEADT
jgi:hypothetical protein